MDKLLFYLLVFALCAGVSHQGRLDRVNEGASTSSEEELNYCERCEISGYAEFIVQLMMSEDMEEGVRVTDMDADALQAFHDEIFSTIYLAEVGAKNFTDENRRGLRLDHLGRSISLRMLEVIVDACASHNYNRLWYEYDRGRNTVIVSQNVKLDTDSCWCNNYSERLLLYTQPFLPDFQTSGVAFQYVSGHINMLQVFGAEVIEYHVIPLSLISRFFQTWLQDRPTDGNNNALNLCAITLIGRLKRSMQKLFYVRLINARNHVNNDINIQNTFNENNAFTVDVFARARNWLGGNIFLGPANRVLSHPNSERTEEESPDDFDYDAVNLMERDHYDELLYLFNELKSFVEESNEMSLVQRIIDGFNLFVSMTLTLRDHEVTYFNQLDWTELHVDNFKSKYWVVRRDPQRRPRFATSKDYYHSVEENNAVEKLSPVGHSMMNLEWTEFVQDLFEILLEAEGKGDNLVWANDFKCMYNDYLFNHLNPIKKNCSTCTSFEEYLFSKISNSMRKCAGGPKNSTREWCFVWGHLRMTNNGGYSKKYDENGRLKISKDRSESYLKHVETFVVWLATKGTPKCKVNKQGSKTSEQYQVQKSTTGGTAEVALCYFSTLIVTLLTWRMDCQKLSN